MMDRIARAMAMDAEEQAAGGYTKAEADTLLAAKADKSNTKTAWKGTAAQYAALQTDDYDLYFIEEASS